MHGRATECQPLTAANRLEVLALGELQARHYRHTTDMHRAVMSGVTWKKLS